MKKLVIEKIDKALEGNKDPNLAMVGEYIKTVMAEDSNLAARILLENKKLDNCYKYVFEKAHKQAVNQAAMVSSDVVFSWVEEYFIGDDLEVDKPKKTYTATSKTTTKKQKEKLPLEMFATNEVVEEDVEIKGAPSDEEMAQMNQIAAQEVTELTNEAVEEEDAEEESISTTIETQSTQQIEHAKEKVSPEQPPKLTGLNQLSFL